MIDQLAELFRKNRFERLEEAIEAGDLPKVRELAMAVRAEYVPAHDGFRDTIAHTLAHLVRRFGPAEGEAIGRSCVEKSMESGDPPQYSQADLRERVKTIALGWHWHATRFTLSEDDERITFRLHPCGSGMRLIREGLYGGGPHGPEVANSGKAPCLPRSTSATRSTFMSEEFPIYCNHCSEMGHVSLKNGTATFLVEGWTPLRSKGLCIQHTYKDIAGVPDEFYRRADLPAPRERGPVKAPKRLFSDAELLEIQTHPLDRLVDFLEAGEVERAQRSLEECLIGWRDCIHDVYRLWPVLLWNEILLAKGETAFTEAVRAAAPDLFGHIRGVSLSQWAAFWSIHLRLREIREDSGVVEFILGEGAILAPKVLERDTTWFTERLNEGLDARGWSDVGRFRVGNGELIHRIRCDDR